MVGLGSLVWWASVSVSGGCCAVVGSRTRHLLKLRMLHFGTRVLTICPLLGGRLVAHGQSVYPCHEDGIQFGPYLTTALDEVGSDVSLSWVGLGWVVLWLGWVRWCGGRRCR